jgi:hypothetical protein
MKSAVLQKTSTGEAAVSGLFSGLWAGLVMAGFLLLAIVLGGAGFRKALAGFSPSDGTGLWVAGLTHLAVSAVYGLAFGLIYTFIAQRLRWEITWWLTLALGAAYGLVLWLLAVYILLPGAAYPLSEITPTVLVGAHLVYGLTLGALIYRRQND